MKIYYIIIGIIFLSCIAFFFTSCQKKPTESKELATTKDTIKPKVHNTKENIYEEMRNMAFKVKPEELGLSLSKDKTEVYGIVMDWEMGGGIATTVAYETGDASLYLSSGGAVIGGGQHQNVNSEAKKFLVLAQTFLDKTIEAETTELPKSNEVIFYFLTNNGVRSGKEKMENFENNSSKWLKLFEEGNNVLTELRKVSGK